MSKQIEAFALARLNDPNSGNKEPTIFKARLEPHRSLSRKGLKIVLGFIAIVMMMQSIVLIGIGAWPASIFLLLDILLVILAFKLNNIAAREFQEIEVSRSHISVLKVDPTGRNSLYEFNPFWTKFVVERNQEHGIIKMTLCSKGFELPIGNFLNPKDKDSFAIALRGAISKANR